MPVERTNGEVRVSAPLTEDDIAQLRAGEHVRFYGHMYTARDAAHRRMIAAAEAGEALPVDLTGQIVYYVGPTPPRPGRVIGSAGPTTAMRMDPFTPKLLELGLKMIIGKGGRGPRPPLPIVILRPSSSSFGVKGSMRIAVVGPAEPMMRPGRGGVGPT